MTPELKRGYSYWQIGFQYLDLAEKTSKLISDQGNKWVVCSEGGAWELKEYEDATKWSDHRLGIPIIFNFYHGVELVLKGFIYAAGNSKIGHKISVLLSRVDKMHPDQKFTKIIRKYIDTKCVPDILKEFINRSSTSFDNWYQAYKYPEDKDGNVYEHYFLKYRESQGAEFFGDLTKDIEDIRVEVVRFARSIYPDLA